MAGRLEPGCEGPQRDLNHPARADVSARRDRTGELRAGQSDQQAWPGSAVPKARPGTAAADRRQAADPGAATGHELLASTRIWGRPGAVGPHSGGAPPLAHLRRPGHGVRGAGNPPLAIRPVRAAGPVPGLRVGRLGTGVGPAGRVRADHRHRHLPGADRARHQ